MTTFTFTDPGGKDHVVTGPEGATQEQAFQILQQHLGASQPPQASPQASGLGDLWQKAMKNLAPEAQKQMAQLAPSWAHNDAAYNPYKAADPNNMPNDAINPVGTDAQMVGGTAAAGLGAAAPGMIARATSTSLPEWNAAKAAVKPPPAPPQVPKFNFPPGPQGPMNTIPGAKFSPLPENPITSAPPLPGTSAAESGLDAQAMGHMVPHAISHGLGLGPLGAPIIRAGMRMLMGH